MEQFFSLWENKNRKMEKGTWAKARDQKAS
jgi:hypothetical protein